MSVAQGIYATDYKNVVWNLLLAKKQQSLPKWLAWGGALLAAKQWYHDAIFGSYLLGSTDAQYNPGTTYTTGMRAIYYINSAGSGGIAGSSSYCGDNGVYEAISINSNGTNNAGFSGAAPSGTTVVPNVAPSWVVDATTALVWVSSYKWVKVADAFIGLTERLSWSCQQLTMEVALNRWFNVAAYSSSQWDHTGSPPYLQIYIETQENPIGSDFFAQENAVSFFAQNSVNAVSWYAPDVIIPTMDFTVFVPYEVFNTLVYPNTDYTAGYTENPPTLLSPGTTNGNSVRALVDKMNATGMYYNIILY